MANKSSHAGHEPERTCVICRKKQKQKDLFRFVILSNRFVIETGRKLSGRGYYCCQNQECLKELPKWTLKRAKKQQKRA